MRRRFSEFTLSRRSSLTSGPPTSSSQEEAEEEAQGTGTGAGLRTATTATPPNTSSSNPNGSLASGASTTSSNSSSFLTAMRRRAQSETPQTQMTRRRAQSDYLNTARFRTLSKGSATSHNNGSGRRLSGAFMTRSRSASGRYSRTRHDSQTSRPRLGSKKDSSVNPIDLEVLDSMALPEHDEEAEEQKPKMEEVKEEEEGEGDDDDDEGCLICMGRFTKKKPSIPIPCTAHCNLAPVHAKCIYEWKEQKKGAGTCPLCRGELGEIDYTPPDLLRMNTLFMFHVRKQFCLTPIPKGAGMVRCYIKAKNGMWGSPVRYEMYIQAPTTLRYPLGVLPSVDSPEKGDRLLMTAYKRLSKWGNSVIDISLDERGRDYDRSGHNYLASLNSTVSGLEHTLSTPFKSSAHGSNAGGHRELASVIYTQNRVGSASGPRRMQVAIPTVKEVDITEEVSPANLIGTASTTEVSISGATGGSSSGNGTSSSNVENDQGASSDDYDSDEDSDDDERLLTKRYVSEVYRPKGKGDQMASVLRKGREAVTNSERLHFGQNKEPYWLDSIQAYSLDFHGRVTLPSNKNFQLEIDFMPEAIAMQFGKVVATDENIPFAVYTVDLQWPISPVQAFGICLSSCSRKLAVA